MNIPNFASSYHEGATCVSRDSHVGSNLFCHVKGKIKLQITKNSNPANFAIREKFAVVITLLLPSSFFYREKNIGFYYMHFLTSIWLPHGQL